MNKSIIRMQRLAGLITEGEEKKKLSLNEVSLETDPKKVGEKLQADPSGSFHLC